MLKAGNKADIQRLHDSFWNREDSFFTWGSEPMDIVLPNITRGQLVVLAATQGAGKTTWSIEMAKQNAIRGIKEGFKVAYLSLEMDPERIIKRAVERTLAINKEDRRRGLIFDMEGLEEKKTDSLARIEEFINTGLLMFPEKEEDWAKLGALESIGKLCEMDNGPALLFIDNLAEIEAPQIRDEYMRLDHIMRELHELTRQTDTTIVLLHHMAKSKMGEPLTINSVKGNNIIVTKPDTVVAIDRHNEANFNWCCQWKDRKGELVEQQTMNKFKSIAPKLEVRAINIFKDRDYAMSGLAGFMRLTDGEIELLDRYSMMEQYPLTQEQQGKLAAALEKYKLVPLKGGQEVINNEYLPWD